MAENPTYKRVLNKLVSKIGTTLVELNDSEFELLRSFIAERYREMHEAWKWIEEMRIEKRYYQDGLWAAGSYAADAIVYYEPEEKYYQNTSGSATTDVPSVGGDWEEVSDFRRYVPFDQTGKEFIAEVYNAWVADPRVSSVGAAREIRYELITGDGVDFGAGGVNVPWMYYRIRPHNYMGDRFDSSLAYVSGDEIFDEETGEYYLVNQAVSAGQTPTTNPEKFTLEAFNYRFETFVVYAAYSDWLDQDERTVDATIWAKKAEQVKLQEMRKVFKQQSQLPKVRVRTTRRPRYGAMSSSVVTGVSS